MDDAAPVESVSSAPAEAAPVAPAFPESAAGYEIRLPGDFRYPEGFEVREGESPINGDDPRVAAARDFAHANKMTQAQFENMLGMGFQHELAEQGALREAMSAEIERLGPKARHRITEVKNWVSAKLPADEAESLLGVLFSAKQIQAMERLMKLNRGAVPGDPGAARSPGNPGMSDEEWDKMSIPDRITYAREHSPRR